MTLSGLVSTAAHPERSIQAAVDGFKKDPSELVGVMLPELLNSPMAGPSVTTSRNTSKGDFTKAPFSPLMVVPHDGSAAHLAPTFPASAEYMALQASGNWPPTKGQ
ncbi:hypothetical protein GCM10010342_43620 [Streptomyces anulatus]|nr:hypothetical protein GCM10010342_43620 [Streptomyces anulatus]